MVKISFSLAGRDGVDAKRGRSVSICRDGHGVSRRRGSVRATSELALDQSHLALLAMQASRKLQKQPGISLLSPQNERRHAETHTAWAHVHRCKGKPAQMERGAVRVAV